MSTTTRTPAFNLKVVMQETGLKADTLRAWERRYGLPQPRRSAGGHRLYSQRDIETLEWLIARQEEGLSISRAVALWRQLESEGQDPRKDRRYGKPESGAAAVFVPQGAAFAQIRESWFSACFAFDEQKAEQVLSYAFALYPPEAVCFEILAKSLVEIGEGWYRGDVMVQQEHFASGLAVRRLEALISAAPAPIRHGRILVGCAPEDEHTFGALLLTFLLRQRGWTVVYLGARVPVARIEAAVSAIEPGLVVLTAQQLHTAATLLTMAQALQRSNVALAFGGRIFNVLPGLHRRIPGHFLGETLEAAPEEIERLLGASPSLPAPEPAPEAYAQALSVYRQRRMLLEADLTRDLTTTVSPTHVFAANEMLARNIGAALALGDISFLDADIEWIEGLLENHHLPREHLYQYLRGYYRAAQKHLGQQGDPLVDWLAKLSDRAVEQEV